MQRYGNEPAELNVLLKRPPEAIDPESNDPSFAVAVCAVTSLLTHVTVPPTLIVTGLGE